MIVLNRIQIEGNLRYFNNSSILFKFYNYKYFYLNRSDDSDRIRSPFQLSSTDSTTNNFRLESYQSSFLTPEPSHSYSDRLRSVSNTR
jgi:hypothetical protein